MATALEAAAEQIAPPRATTNYFDPAAGQSIVSRYAQAGREVQDAGLAAEAADQLTRSRMDRAQQRRQDIEADREKILWTREDEEYADRKDFKLQRGKFLRDLAAIKPDAEDFYDQISALKGSLPPGAWQDDAVVDMLKSAEADARDYQNARQAEAAKQQTLQNQLSMFDRRSGASAALKGLPPERLQQLTDPVTGLLDMETAMYEAGQIQKQGKADAATKAFERRKELYSMSQADREAAQKRSFEQQKAMKDMSSEEKAAAKEQQVTLDALRAGVTPDEIEKQRDEDGNLDIGEVRYLTGIREREIKKTTSEQAKTFSANLREKLKPVASLGAEAKARRTEAEGLIQGDQTAFPSQMSSLLRQYRKDNPGGTELDLETDMPEEYRKAKEYDDNRFVSELGSALNMDEATYVNKAGDKLDPGLKEKRRKVWRHAQEAFSGLPAPAAPQGVVEDYVPPAAAPALPPGLPEGTQIREKDGVRYARTPDGKVYRITE